MISAERRAKLIWNCRRGMLELDLILNRFVTSHLDSLTTEQMAAFETLLTAQDPDLYAWLMGYEASDNKETQEIVAFIQHYNNA